MNTSVWNRVFEHYCEGILESRESPMRKQIVYMILPLALVLSVVFVAVADMGSASYLIPSSAISGGGASMESASYKMTSTLGQLSVIGQSSRRSYILYAGFWQPDILKIKRRAMPWVPLLLLDE